MRESVQRIFHPGIGSAVSYEVEAVPEDADGQVAKIIDLMTGYVNQDYRTPEVTARAVEALQYHPQDPLQAVFEHVKGKIHFALDETIAAPLYPLLSSRDQEAVEVLIRPVDMAGMEGAYKLGDCDDFAMYTAALLLNLGIPCSFVTIAADQGEPERFSHVYVAAYPLGGGRVAMDTSHGDGPGWESPHRYRIAEWPLQGMGRGGWVLLGLALAGVWAMGKGRN